jgi:hypothetical protein
VGHERNGANLVQARDGSSDNSSTINLWSHGTLEVEPTPNDTPRPRSTALGTVVVILVPKQVYSVGLQGILHPDQETSQFLSLAHASN